MPELKVSTRVVSYHQYINTWVLAYVVDITSVSHARSPDIFTRGARRSLCVPTRVILESSESYFIRSRVV